MSAETSQGASALVALQQVCAEARYGTEAEGVLGVEPAYVAVPATVAEAAEVMRVAAAHGLSVVPRGGETRLDWGNPPTRCDLILDTSRLDRVIEHAAGDLIVKVEAGLPMEVLAEVLAAKGQQLAIDTPLEGSTVGGSLATAACGPRAFRYGGPRDLLIGITVLRADGTLARAGGKVVKNVAGYDLGKLFTGSYGTLGVIVEAAFRLHPIPEARAWISAETPSLAAASELAQRVAHSLAVPSAIEVDSPPGGPTTLAVLVEGVAAGLPDRAAQIAEILGPDARTEDVPPEWWGRYPDTPVLVETDTAWSTRPDVLQPEVTQPPRPGGAQTGEAGAARVDGGDWFAWAGGGVHVRGSVAAGRTYVGTDAASAVEIVSWLREHGRAVVRYAPEQIRQRLDLWGPVSALPLMRRVKDQFDPEHRMSPGRFVGGV